MESNEQTKSVIMMATGNSKKCLILSAGPVPVPEHKKVEGGGLRCWGLAQGLKKNNPELDITIAYDRFYKVGEDGTDEYKGIKITTWELGTLPELMADFDSIVVSYCMGNLSVRVVDMIRVDQQLILDCYVPIYVEVSARQSDNLKQEYDAFQQEVPRWSHVLRRGDLFLCASVQQKHFYEGVLAGIGRVNPATYGEELILVVPYGIYRDEPKPMERPIDKLIGDEASKYKKILWFGGIYPWFDLRGLIEAIKVVNETVPTKLVIVGARNPFNGHPDFIKRAEDLIDYISKEKLEDIVLLQDWVSFENRADWYMNSDLTVVVNKEGGENALAWRTRLVDFTWANLPIITNAGDPFGELLLEARAAVRFTGLSTKDMAADISRLLSDPGKLQTIRSQLQTIRSKLYWDVVTKELSERVKSHYRPNDFASMGICEVVAPHQEEGMRITFMVKNKFLKYMVYAIKLPLYIKRHGLRFTYHTSRGLILRKMGVSRPDENTATSSKSRIVVVSHQLDMSGAPFVIIDFVKILRKHNPKLPLDFYTYAPIHNENIVALNQSGVRAKVINNRKQVINFCHGDIVLLNTVGHSTQLKEKVFADIENGIISKLLWYIHEDAPEFIFSVDEKRRITELMQQGKIDIFTVAAQTRDHYLEYFGKKLPIHLQPYRLDIPKEQHHTHTAREFHKKLSFVLPGTFGDGRKGQLPIFYAFAEFLRVYYHENPKQYRNFELVYVGVEDDFLSRQVLNHANKALGKHFRYYPRVTKEESLRIIAQSNVTICYSLSESLPMFVFEGMISGHPIMRNDASGMAEQFVNNENGYFLDSKDFYQVVEAIEKILNRSTTTDQKLADMSQSSYQIAIKQENCQYTDLLHAVEKAYQESVNP